MIVIDGKNVLPKASLSWREVNGELVVIDRSSGEYHILNDLGGIIWRAILEEESEKEIVAKIEQKYSVTHEQAVMDLRGFIHGLMQKQLLEKPSPNSHKEEQR